MTSYSNQNKKRDAIGATLREAGLVQIAGGTRNTYYGLPGQGVDGQCVRVGIRTYRLVRRVRLWTELADLSVGRENYHGQADLAKVLAWARQLREERFAPQSVPEQLNLHYPPKIN